MENEIQIIEPDNKVEAFREDVKEFAQIAKRSDRLSYFQKDLVRGGRRGRWGCFHNGRITSGSMLSQIVLNFRRDVGSARTRRDRQIVAAKEIHKSVFFT
jgi:hypothetical protein